MTQICVSVIIITYNQVLYIEKAIQSILNQKLTEKFEIIIGDDYSTDGTRIIINSFKETNPELIKLHFPSNNEGLLNNYANCLILCDGKYITVCAGDDFWHDEFKLSKQVNFLKTHIEFGMVHSNVDFLYEKSGRIKKSVNKNNSIESGFIFEKLLIDNFIIAVSSCVRNELVKSFIDFDEYMKLNFKMEDYPMWLELSKRTKIGYLEDSTATYRIHDRSIRNTNNWISLFEFLKSTYAIKNHFIEKYGCSSEVKEIVEIRYLKKLLFFGVIFEDRILAENAFLNLKAKLASINIKEYLYYYTCKSALLRSIASRILKYLHSLNYS